MKEIKDIAEKPNIEEEYYKIILMLNECDQKIRTYEFIAIKMGWSKSKARSIVEQLAAINFLKRVQGNNRRIFYYTTIQGVLEAKEFFDKKEVKK